MSDKSDYLENAILNHVLRNTALASPGSVFLAIGSRTGDSFTELETPGQNGYARQAISFAAPSGGSCASSNSQTFGAATSDWASATAFAIFDAATGGNVLYIGNLAAARDAGIGDSILFGNGDITVAET